MLPKFIISPFRVESQEGKHVNKRRKHVISFESTNMDVGLRLLPQITSSNSTSNVLLKSAVRKANQQSIPQDFCFLKTCNLCNKQLSPDKDIYMYRAKTVNAATTQNKKRGKIEIKEVEQRNRRYVTFSKRKLGLFNKLTELSVLCQVETAVIITSQNGKLYSCGYPDPDAVVRRYLTGGPPLRRNRANKREQQEFVEQQRLEYEAVQNQLKEEKKRLQEIKGTQNNNGFCFAAPWWNLPTEGMGLEDLEQFKTSLERLKFNLVGALQEKQMNSVPSMPHAAMLPPMPSTVVPPVPHAAMVPPMSSTMVPPVPHAAMVPPMMPPQFQNMSLLRAQRLSGNQVQDDYWRSAAIASTASTFASNVFGSLKNYGYTT
ncbi:agamous-like MADS-box protein AGL28 [Glycine soja]|uniref:agamous-like MADS-box protein AGL28 n=1 Tax=Glycine soja TaxID=3848 RepID=UPI00103B9BFB|nr:agamous-like MADS-box protein AGL28 [Glycine soja]